MTSLIRASTVESNARKSWEGAISTTSMGRHFSTIKVFSNSLTSVGVMSDSPFSELRMQISKIGYIESDFLLTFFEKYMIKFAGIFCFHPSDQLLFCPMQPHFGCRWTDVQSFGNFSECHVVESEFKRASL